MKLKSNRVGGDPSDDITVIALKPPSERGLSNVWLAIMSPSALVPSSQSRASFDGQALPAVLVESKKGA